jgi:hypothetical protein
MKLAFTTPCRFNRRTEVIMKTKCFKLSGCMTIMLTLAAGTMTAQHAFAQGGGQECSVATLKGSYQFASSGFVRAGAAAVPLAVAGIDVLDGHGNLTSNSTLVVNGAVIFQNAVVSNGTYTIREDCTGTLNLGTSGIVLDIFVAASGDSFDYVQTSPSGNVLAGTIRRTSHNTK